MNKEELEEYKAYLASRKSSHKTNYYQMSLEELEKIKATNHRPRLLLHSCCGPCSAWPIEFLHQVFDITILYNNSNIWPKQEFEHRRDEMIRLLPDLGYDDIDIVVPPYDNATYTKEVLAERKDDPEGWKRCFHCYETRMEEGFRYAKEHQIPWFTTVMTISRQKDSQILNEIGKKLAAKYPEVNYFFSDFKKAGGQNRRDQIVKDLDLYHQEYCGCVYSYIEREKKTHEQKCDI